VDGIALLRIVTLAYVAILVLALATVLTTIAVYLWRIASMLERIRGALGEMRERTAPIAAHFQGLDALTEEHVREFEQATIALERSVGIFNTADVIEEQAFALAGRSGGEGTP